MTDDVLDPSFPADLSASGRVTWVSQRRTFWMGPLMRTMFSEGLVCALGPKRPQLEGNHGKSRCARHRTRLRTVGTRSCPQTPGQSWRNEACRLIGDAVLARGGLLPKPRTRRPSPRPVRGTGGVSAEAPCEVFHKPSPRRRRSCRCGRPAG